MQGSDSFPRFLHSEHYKNYLAETADAKKLRKVSYSSFLPQATGSGYIEMVATTSTNQKQRTRIISVSQSAGTIGDASRRSSMFGGVLRQSMDISESPNPSAKSSPVQKNRRVTKTNTNNFKERSSSSFSTELPFASAGSAVSSKLNLSGPQKASKLISKKQPRSDTFRAAPSGESGGGESQLQSTKLQTAQSDCCASKSGSIGDKGDKVLRPGASRGNLAINM